MRSLAAALLLLSTAAASASCDFPRSTEEAFACFNMSAQAREETKPLQQAYDREMDAQHARDQILWSDDRLR